MIRVLPKELINQIAAGEVVERPASVVKELIENSIDSGALNIVVEIENGGINLIKISDNGSGMNREDSALSVTEHATSKISSQDDLDKINTLGFRGEALASIASVSEFTLITGERGAISGTRVEVKNGEVALSEAGAPAGTAVSVKNLFYNIPARKKYLKTPVTEFNHIVDLFLNYCLAFPNISFKLIHNGKPVYHFPAAKLAERIADALGDEIGGNLLAIDLTLNDIQISGYLGLPSIARNNRKLQYLFINHRPVNEFIAAKNIKDAFVTLLPKDLYPVYILNLQIESEAVDVNVHPRKLEVRFSEPQLIYRTLYQAVSRTLDENDLQKQVLSGEMKKFIPITEILTAKQAEIPIKKIEPKQEFYFPEVNRTFTSPETEILSAYLAPADQIEEQSKQETMTGRIDEPFVPEYKILGQVQNSYIVAETETGIKIYDQHASSERVQYEKLKREWQIGNLASQMMLIPQNIELAPAEARLLNDNLELFQKLGFEIIGFGSKSFAVSAAPPFFAGEDIKSIVRQIIGELNESFILDEKIAEPVDKIFKMMACKSAIKFGDALTAEGMEALINDLEKLGNKYTCVHGRPAVLEFSFSELEKLFKRK